MLAEVGKEETDSESDDDLNITYDKYGREIKKKKKDKKDKTNRDLSPGLKKEDKKEYGLTK